MKKIVLIGFLLVTVMGVSAEGFNLPFTNDGKLYEEKLINREIYATDTEVKIEKTKDGNYQITTYFYDDEKEDHSYKVEKIVKKENMFCDESVCIGYDIKLKKAVFLDKNDLRIIYPED